MTMAMRVSGSLMISQRRRSREPSLRFAMAMAPHRLHGERRERHSDGAANARMVMISARGR